MKSQFLPVAATWTACIAVLAVALSSACAADYAIVVSQATYDDAEWQQVVETLKTKHDGNVIIYESSINEALPELKVSRPRHTCFIATSKEASRQFVAQVHQLTRKLDDDPYTDTLWGILTGYDAAAALRIAQRKPPLIVKKAAAGTGIALEMVTEGICYSETQKNHMVRKLPGKTPTQEECPDDTTKALVDTLNKYHADLFVTSGHATERDWRIGYAYRNGTFQSKAGKLFGKDTQGNTYPIVSPNPKVYMPIGNCLMGHINGPDAMALAWMNSAGVYQMIGYTVPTWFGYAGWGCLDYFVEQPGRYTFTEAFFANHHALIYSLENNLGNQRGLKFDRDVVAFYGDPAWEARMADLPKAYEQTLTEANGIFTFIIRGNRGGDSFAIINGNGSQRGGRPIVQYLPYRVENAEVLEDAGLKPVISDDFVLVPNLQENKADHTYTIRFRASRVEGN